MAENNGGAPLRLPNVNIKSGETSEFGSDESTLVGADYDENVVPGVTVGVILTFGNAETISSAAPVT